MSLNSLILGIVLGSGITSAQKPVSEISVQECATSPTAEERVLLEQNQLQGLYYLSLWDQAIQTHYVPVAIHIVRNADGSGGFPSNLLCTGISTLNESYLQIGIQFFLVGPIDFIDDDDLAYIDYYDEGVSELNELRLIRPVPNAINLYLTYLGGIRGISSFTTSPVQGVVVNINAMPPSNLSTLPHEFGHYFDLYHTHTTAYGSEYVDGSNCSVAGDLICDTPADPDLSGVVDSTCLYWGDDQDPHGDFYDPDTHNYMSYSTPACRDQFSTGQYNRALATLINLRPELQVIPAPSPSDCNENSVSDCTDIALGNSADTNSNGLPDECDCPLASPTGLSASDGSFCDRIRLQWQNQLGFVSFKVWRNTNLNFNSATYLGTTASNSFDDFNTQAGNIYFYWIQSTASCGNSEPGSPDTGMRGVAPGVPQNLSASFGGSCNQVQITWANVPGASNYRVLRSTSPISSTASFLANDNASPYTDTNPFSGVTNYYWVQAQNACGSGILSSFTSFQNQSAPQAPTQVTTDSPGFCDRVRIRWNASAGANSYSIWRSQLSNPQSATQIGTDNASPFDDTSASPGLLYRYWIKAIGPCGTSGFSQTAEGHLALAPLAPATLSASNGTYCDYVHLEWSAAARANAYQVLRGGNNHSENAQVIATVTETSYDDYVTSTNLRYYWIRAINDCGQSGLSPLDTGRRGAAPPIPNNVFASDGNWCDRVRVEWTESSEASIYRIYRSQQNNFASAGFVGADNETPYNDLSAAPGVLYYYWVIGVNDCGVSNPSISNSGIRAITATPPTAVSASDGVFCDRVRVTWNSVPTASYYIVFRNTVNNSSTAIQAGTSTSNSFNDSSAAPGVTYYYWVVSSTACGNSSPSTSNTGWRCAP